MFRIRSCTASSENLKRCSPLLLYHCDVFEKLKLFVRSNDFPTDEPPNETGLEASDDPFDGRRTIADGRSRNGLRRESDPA